MQVFSHKKVVFKQKYITYYKNERLKELKNYKKILSQNIKEKRKAMGITQYQLAEMLNVEDKYISRLETGTSTPSFALLEKLSNILNINLSEFFVTENTIEKEELINQIILKLKRTNIKNLTIISKVIDGIID